MPSEGLFERYINFYTDFAFKKFFGTPANKEFLISFLNALLKLKGDEEIKDITHLNTEQLPNIESDRKAIYDVYCENNKGEKFIVEMQRASQINFVDRSIYYSAFPIQEQGVRGYLSKIDEKYINWDYSLKKVYVVGILSFILDENPNHNEIVTHARLRYDEYSNEIYSDKLEFINIELPKFTKQEEELDDDNMLDKWLFAIKNLYHLMDRPQTLREAIFKRLFNLAEISKYNKTERLAYQESLKDYRDYYNTIFSAEERGREEGREEGRAEGRAEAETKAYQEKLDMARKMKSDGMPYEIITKYSGLSIPEIEKL
ncbi:MAG: Rpn family recombination-promoting nuclease/putative transposase [Bacteroidales bacterium]|nr:Rpn family recombination-promoting nuclease/putative transposase [Bacteroidales bacterium]